MAKQLIKSKYEIIDLISEDIISFSYMGKTHYSGVPVLIWKYKKEYLSSTLVTRLINLCERLIPVSHTSVLDMIDYYYDGHSFYTIHEGESRFITLDTYVKQNKEVDLKKLWSFSTTILNGLLELEQKHLYCGAVNFTDLIITDQLELKISRTTIPVEIYKASWKKFKVLEDCIFFAPEFILNGQYTSRSDMYAFGVLMYIFFSQKWPYKYSIKIDQMKKAIVEGPIEFEPVNPRVPDQLGRIIKVCLSPDPEGRFRTFLELIKVYRGDISFKADTEISKSPIQNRLHDYIKEKQWLYYVKFIKTASVVVGIVLIGFISHLFYMNYMRAIPEVAVPNLVGVQEIEAEDMLEQYQLRSLVSGARFHPSVEKGYVIETKPPSGRIVKENRVVRLFISKGTGPVLVPDLIGHTRETIDDALVEKGYNTKIVKEMYSLQYPKGTVIAQDPSANTFIGPSENIKLVLSKGHPVEVTVKKAKPSFFQDKTQLRRVIVEFFIIKEWASQEIAIYYNLSNKREKIYSDLIDAGDTLKLEFELDLNGHIEVFFNNELTIKKEISDTNDDSDAII